MTFTKMRSWRIVGLGMLVNACLGTVYSWSVFREPLEAAIGISAGQAPPAGTLPSISNNRDWLRQAQRFPVVVGFDPFQEDELITHDCDLDLGANLRAGIMNFERNRMIECYQRIATQRGAIPPEES